jgi:hypothetical protein
MKIIDTFAIVNDSLFSVQYEHEGSHELDKCFDFWNDPEALRFFFESNLEDLNDPFWEGITIEEAIRKTRRDAKNLERTLIQVAEDGKMDRLNTLSTIFEPLSEGVIEKDFEKDKLKGFERKSWLRIYAIRVQANLFVVTGAAIKLTKTMNERSHLISELKKLEITKSYLQDGENDSLDLVEIY